LRLAALVCTKITLYDVCTGSPIRLEYAKGAMHHAHKALAAFFRIVLHVAGGCVFDHGAAHTAFGTGRIGAMAAKERLIPLLRIGQDGVA